MIMPAPPLMLVTDRHLAATSLEKTIMAALAGGCRWVLYRDNDCADDIYLDEAKKLHRLCREHGAHFFVSRRTHIAKSLGADGLHISARQSVKEARAVFDARPIGQSCHGDAEIKCALEEGADYITLGPIYPTASKPGYGPALGIDLLRKRAASCPVPVVAQGGITPDLAPECLKAGARAVAVMGPLMRAEYPERLMREYIALCGGH